MIRGMGVTASRAINGESTKNTASTAPTVTATWIMRCATVEESFKPVHVVVHSGH